MRNKLLWIVLFPVVFLAGVGGTYLVLTRYAQKDEGPMSMKHSDALPSLTEDLFIVKITYPKSDGLDLVEKKLPRRLKSSAIAEAVVEEYFRGPGGAVPSTLPAGVKVLGIYMDQQQVMYIDLSDEVRRNFQGDSLSEYLLLKGLFESILLNVPEVQDLKVLVEGREIDSLGGHFSLRYPLRALVAASPAPEMKP